MAVDLHHMRHFAAVAEELHFGRAAARLGIAQPPLSQSIKRLEADLGFPLFERTQRRVELTPAGEVFLTEARRTLEQSETAVRLAQQAASEHLASLTVTFVSAALYQVLPAALRAHRKRFPKVDIRLDERPSDAQLAGLRDGSVDLGFLHPPLKDLRGLQSETIARDRFIVALPSASPLARRRKLDLAELGDQDFVLFPHRQGPSLHGRLMAACRRAGFLPRIAQEAGRMHTLLSLVAAGLGVSLVPEGARSLPIAGVTFVPLHGLPEELCWELMIVWRARGLRPPLRSFTETLRSVADSTGKPASPSA